MARVTTNDRHYADIAAAIRGKLQTDDAYRPAEMAAAIASIEGGERCPHGEASSVFDFGTLHTTIMSWSSSASGEPA